MDVGYIVPYIMLVCIGLYLYKKYSNVNLIFTVASACILIPFIGLQQGFVTDYTAYQQYYKIITDLPWINPLDLETGFKWVNAFLGKIGFSFEFYFFCLTAFVVSSILIYLYKNSLHMYFPVLIMLSLFAFPYIVGTTRQGIACAICLLGHPFCEKRRPLLYACCIALACCFHKSAIVFVLVYLISYVKISNSTAFTLLFFFAMLSFLLPQIFSFIFQFDSKYFRYIGSQYMDGSSIFSLIAPLLFFSVACINRKFQKEKYSIFFNYALLGMIFALFQLRVGIFIRFFGYFTPLCAPLLSDLLKNFKTKQDKRFVFTTFQALLFAYYLYQMADYPPYSLIF